jgi:hypothetical protein
MAVATTRFSQVLTVFALLALRCLSAGSVGTVTVQIPANGASDVRIKT